MRWIYKLPLRLRSLFRKSGVEHELSDELRFHLERLIEENIAGGMTAEEARYAARRELGGMEQIKEECRDMRRVNFVDDLLKDLGFGLRQLRRNPGFTAVAVVTLALGIGANTAIFSLIDAVALRPLPVRTPARLVVVTWEAGSFPAAESYYGWDACPSKSVPSPASAGCALSYPMFEQIRAEKGIFTGVFALDPADQLGVSANGNASFASGKFVSGDFFATLGLHAAVGRLLAPTDDRPSASPAVVLSHRYWKQQFGGNRSMIGSVMIINNVPFTIAGVGPAGFLGLDPGGVNDLWLPLSMQPRLIKGTPKSTDAASLWLMAGARLRKGVTPEQAEAATDVIFSRNVTSGPKPLLRAKERPRVKLVSMEHGLGSIRRAFRNPTIILMVAVALVLLIACANIATLMLARMGARGKELAVRLAVGADRWRIIRQLLTESFLLAAAGAALGGLIARWGANLLVTFFAGKNGPGLDINLHPDLRVLGFTAAIAALAGILFGLAPALRSTRVDLAPLLKESARNPPTSKRRRLRLGDALVTAQVALSVLVLTGAMLLVRTVIDLETAQLGFDARNVIIFTVNPDLIGYKGQRLADLLFALRQRLRETPGLTSVAYSSLPLLSEAYLRESAWIPSQQRSIDNIDILDVGPSFFETMRIPLLLGRTFDERDFTAKLAKQGQKQELRLAVVNQTVARDYFGKVNPVGKLISSEKGKAPDIQVVGVVADAKYYSVDQGNEPTMYFPMQPGGGTFEVRTAMNPKALMPSILDAVKKVDSNLPVQNLMTQREQLGQTIFPQRLLAWITALFALLALVLASVGLYGLLAYEVARQTHEIGVRMALGARQGDVLRLVIRRGVLLTLAGLAAGIAGALALMQLLSRGLYGVKPTDPLTFAAVSLGLTAVALLASYVPARRATKVDPMVALRYE
jgi:predicted permease